MNPKNVPIYLAGTRSFIGLLMHSKKSELALFCIFISMHSNALSHIVHRTHHRVVLTSLSIIACCNVLAQLVRYAQNLQDNERPRKDLIARPLLFPSRIAHTRLFPKKHAFSYSYLYVGIPVGWQGSVGGMLAADVELKCWSWLEWITFKARGSSWYTVHADDYLARGHVVGGLRSKLARYLISQGIEPEEYPHAYLFTAARFLGYAFNPLSIWYLYTPDKRLSAMILEVNNTFDERHLYFLETSNPRPDHASNYHTFTGHWPKDFYVSPLNSREGTYSITSSDPLSNNPPKIQAAITLISSQCHPKLVARVCSDAPALDPTTMSLVQKTIFLTSWWWVGFATFFIRTVRQAFILKFILGLPWFFRPEPGSRTMSRVATSTEVFLEGLLRKYLRFLVEQCDVPMKVIYTPSGLPDNSAEVMMAPPTKGTATPLQTLDIRVLTPSFYTAIIHDTLALDTTQLLEISDPNLLAHLNHTTPFRQPHSSPIQPSQHSNQTSHPSSPPPTPLQASGFHQWLSDHCSKEERKRYQTQVTKAKFAKYIALGSVDVLAAETLLLRCAVLWWAAGVFCSQSGMYMVEGLLTAVSSVVARGFEK